MTSEFCAFFANKLAKLDKNSLLKNEHALTSPQQAQITTDNGKQLINFCSNNYLGLANHPELIQAAIAAAKQYGCGLASARFICGTHELHLQLEQKLSNFLNTQASLLFSSCFDANNGIFPALLEAPDAVISDSLNHASIIDGIRLCKAKRFVYQHNNMQDLKQQLIVAKDARFKLIVTDGVFSMHGTIANLPEIIKLAKQYHAEVMVDDCHATGVIGNHGRGTIEFFGLENKIEIVTGTFGKALGGASGGYISGKTEIIEYLRQTARTYLFSNSIPPILAAVNLQALALIENNWPNLQQKLNHNTNLFRSKIQAAGFKIISGKHPIVPILLGDEQIAAKMAKHLLTKGIYVVSFCYPVVPFNQARIRVQLSASHTEEQINYAIQNFIDIGKELKVIK